jgi:hypothetical protein
MKQANTLKVNKLLCVCVCRHLSLSQQCQFRQCCTPSAQQQQQLVLTQAL